MNKSILKFIILSIIGVFLYFIPVASSKVPVVVIVSYIKGILGNNLKYLVLLMLVLLMISIIGAKFFKNNFCIRLHSTDSIGRLIHYVIAFLVVIAVWFKLPPTQIFADERVGGKILDLAGTVMLTVSICGWFIVFILKSGIVEFVGTLLEPFMRPLFKMPGAVAINFLSSYVVSAAVGVYMTDKYYEEKTYNKREATAAAVCFSTISVGYIGVLCSIAKIESKYGLILVLTFILAIVMTAIMVRIPPLSKLKDSYYKDNESIEKNIQDEDKSSRLKRALQLAAMRSEEFSLKEFMNSLFSSLKFSQRIIAYMIPIVIVTLSLVHYTQLFNWLGYPISPILKLLGLTDTNIIAPAVILGFIEVSLPAISVSSAVAEQSAFFVVLLSIMQIIFMTEAGNAMLGTKFKIKFLDLIIYFVERTVIALPIIAILTHLIYK